MSREIVVPHGRGGWKAEGAADGNVAAWWRFRRLRGDTICAVDVTAWAGTALVIYGWLQPVATLVLL